MQFLFAIPILLALAGIDWPSALDFGGVHLRSTAVVITTLVTPWLASWVHHRMVSSRLPAGASDWAVHLPNVLWALGSLWLTCILGWSQLVIGWIGQIDLASSFLILVPHIVALILTWIWTTASDRYRSQGIYSRVALLWARETWQHIGPRVQWYLLPIGLPLTIVLVARELLEQWPTWETLPASHQVFWLSGGSMIFVVLALPIMLSRILPTRPLEPQSLEQELGSRAKTLGVSLSSVKCWDTRWSTANAMVMGWAPGTRNILLSDVLCVALNRAELEAVFLHEVGHIVRRHFWWKMAVVFFALETAILLVHCLPWDIQEIEHWPMIAMAAFACSVLSLFSALAYVLGAFSRMLEFDADRFVMNVVRQRHHSDTDRSPPSAENPQQVLGLVGSASLPLASAGSAAASANMRISDRGAVATLTKELLTSSECRVSHDSSSTSPVAVATHSEKMDSITLSRSLMTAVSKTVKINGVRPDRVTWMHPSLLQRLRQIQMHQRYPETIDMANRELAWYKGMLLAAICIAGVGLLFS